MKKIRSMSYMKKGQTDKLVLMEEEIVDPQKNEVQVHVHRAGISMGDIIEGSNTVKKISKYPWTPGYDFSGEIVAIGNEVTNFKVGDRVTGYSTNGCYRNIINTLEQCIVHIPQNVDYATAAAININYTTAFSMMKDEANLSNKDVVLVHSAAGGVGSATLDLAKLWNIKIYGTASGKKQDFVSSYGGIPIDYKKTDFVESIKEREPNGIDVVFVF